MKKLFYLVVVVAILGLVLTGCLLSNVGQVPTTEQSGIAYLTKGTPKIITLYAGKDIDVGEVEVWNDADKLYVEYVITVPGWCLTETHVHVGKALENFPLAGKWGNPVPGQFDYSKKHDPCPCVTTYTYEIPLGDLEVSDESWIAAHAVIEECASCFDGTSGVTIEGTEDLDIDGSITVEALVKVESSTDGKFYTIVAKWNEGDDARAWLLGIFNMLPCFYISPNGDNFNWEKAISENELIIGQWYHLKGTFNAGNGEIKICVDNVFEVTNYSNLVNIYLNEEPVLIGGDCGGGGKRAFFNGCIDEVKVWDGIEEGAAIVLEWPETPETETAWADGKRFTEQGNWATYFSYSFFTEQVGLIEVDASSTFTNPVSINLDAGTYKFVVSDTALAGDTIEFDAKYSITKRIVDDTWTDTVSGYVSYGPLLLDLFVNGASVDWGAYNEQHIYEYLLTGWTGGAVTFHIYDTYPSNNSGHLTVKIYKQ